MTTTTGREVAIVGYAHSPITRKAQVPLGVLTIETCLRAIADAGLRKEQIDGFTTSAMFASDDGRRPVDGVDVVTSDWVVDRLGATPRWLSGFQGIGQLPGAFVLASNAIAAGAADYVLVHRSMVDPPGRYHVNPMTEATGPHQWTAPFGNWGPPLHIALPYMEYLQRYGATREAMAAVVVEARRNGATIPWSYWHDKPLTPEAYLESRLVADPIAVLDCDIPVTGVGAFVLTSAERAADLPHPPVTVRGYAQSRVRSPNRVSEWGLDDMMAGGAQLARALWDHTGLRAGDVDLPQLYDGFSPFVYFWLEALGFCPPGEAHRFVQDGGIRTGTGLPVLSGGGALGNGRMHGVPQIVECYLQLAGRAGPRQLDVDVALATQAAPNFGAAIAFSRNP